MRKTHTPTDHIKKKKKTELKGFQVKNHLWVFVNALIENPAFDSQTKEALTTRATAFGSDVVLSDKFLKQVEKSGVVDRVLSWAKVKHEASILHALLPHSFAAAAVLAGKPDGAPCLSGNRF